jgi:hypothetical protein
MMIRTIRRTVPSPMYMRLPPFVADCFFPAGSTHKPTSPGSEKREEKRLDRRLEAVSPRFFLRVAFAALVLAALLGALTQLAAGRRPVLLGGQTV